MKIQLCESGYEDFLEYLHKVLAFHKPTQIMPTINDIGHVDERSLFELEQKYPGKHIFETRELLLVFELITWQEITRYPNGSLTSKILGKIASRDIFSAVGIATRKLA
jgi:hypothetical protein